MSKRPPTDTYDNFNKGSKRGKGQQGEHGGRGGHGAGRDGRDAAPPGVDAVAWEMGYQAAEVRFGGASVGLGGMTVDQSSKKIVPKLQRESIRQSDLMFSKLLALFPAQLHQLSKVSIGLSAVPPEPSS